MKTVLFACAIVFVVTGVALSSVHRVIVTKDTQEKSGIDISLTVEPVHGPDQKPRSDGYSKFTLSIPSKQKALEHLWRTELWILDQAEGRTVLSVPVALRQKPTGEMSGELSLSSRLVEHAILALRCGKNAPLAETIYQVQLKTYLEQTTSPSSADGGWRGLHKKSVRLRVLNLNETKASVEFFYHAPPDMKMPPELEGRVVKETKKEVMLGVTVWKPDVAFHAYDKKRKTLEVYLLPEHLKDPKEVRIQILPLTKFDAPRDIKTVRIVYLP